MGWQKTWRQREGSALRGRGPHEPAERSESALSAHHVDEPRQRIRRQQRRLSRHRHQAGRRLHVLCLRPSRDERAGRAPRRFCRTRPATSSPDGQLDGFDRRRGSSYEHGHSRERNRCRRPTRIVYVDDPGTLDLDMVSLFPDDTWKHRPNGLRADLVQLLNDMHPGFIRFPGGCIVEGRHLDTRYQLEEHDRRHRRPQADHQPLERRVRPTPGARLLPVVRPGLLRILSAWPKTSAREPLPILNCGMACQFNSGELGAARRARRRTSRTRST